MSNNPKQHDNDSFEELSNAFSAGYANHPWRGTEAVSVEPLPNFSDFGFTLESFHVLAKELPCDCSPQELSCPWTPYAMNCRFHKDKPK